MKVANDLDIEVIEPNWDDHGSEDAKHMVPLKTVDKDPKVLNKELSVPGYVYIEVKVPVAEVSIMGENGPQAPSLTPLFTYETNDKWVKVEEYIDGDTIVKRYYYNEIVLPGEETQTLFDQVTLVNLVQAQGQSGIKQIDIVGYGIQTEGFEDQLTAWTAYKNQNKLQDSNGELLGDAYALFVDNGLSTSEINRYYDLYFVRSETPFEVGDYYNDYEIAYVFSDFEDKDFYYNNGDNKYYPEWQSIKVPTEYSPVPLSQNTTNVYFENKIRPKSLCGWFCGMGNDPVAGYLSKTSIGLGYNVDQSCLENVSHMFDWAYFNAIDLYHFNISKVKYVNSMIYCCYNLETIYCDQDFSEYNFDNCSEMLYGNFKLTGHKGTVYNYEWATDNTYARPDGGESDPGYFSIKISA